MFELKFEDVFDVLRCYYFDFKLIYSGVHFYFSYKIISTNYHHLLALCSLYIYFISTLLLFCFPILRFTTEFPNDCQKCNLIHKSTTSFPVWNFFQLLLIALCFHCKAEISVFMTFSWFITIFSISHNCIFLYYAKQFYKNII